MHKKTSRRAEKRGAGGEERDKTGGGGGGEEKVRKNNKREGDQELMEWRRERGLARGASQDIPEPAVGWRGNSY